MIDSPLASENDGLGVPVSTDEQRSQLQKVLDSEAFRNAPGLQKFLEYVTRKTIEGFSHEIKEYAIGADVFGKTAEYDPKIDTAVRVQANRLREKLKKYYEGQGASDTILLSIPKGHYVPCFSRRALSARPAIANSQPSPDFPASRAAEGGLLAPELVAPRHFVIQDLRPGGRALGLSLMLLAVAVMGAALFFVPRLGTDRGASSSGQVGRSTSLAATVDNPLRALWGDFFKDTSSPMVGYSNSIFLATEQSDLLRLKSDEIDNAGAPARSDVARKLSASPRLLDRAGPVFFEDLYTGTGEVMAVFYLTRLFAQEHLSSLGVKRGRLVTIADLSQHDMIFLGSTVENSLLAKLPLTQDFVFVLPPNAPHLWGWRIVNLHPQRGESPFYETERDSKTQVLRADYALVSFLPGITRSRRIAVLAGLTTIGTQAAAEFATSPAGSAEILAHLGSGAPPLRRLPPFFQALLRVEIMKGDVLRVEYITGHAIQSGPVELSRG